jgi:hypothetical protein
MTTATVAATVQRSWAAIVKGGSAGCDSTGEASWPRLKPATRGSLMCFCRGEVLTLLSHYGWFLVYGEVDHPSANKHDGHVYVSKQDFPEGKALAPGDVVSFYLYADDKGLGAENCCLEKSITTNGAESGHLQKTSTPNFNPQAIEFAPVDMPPKTDGKMQFEVSPFGANRFNEPTIEETNPHKKYAGLFRRLSQVFVDDSDSDDDFTSTKSQRIARSSLFAHKGRAKRAVSPDGSTSAGTSSDSEGDCSCDSFPVSLAKISPDKHFTFRPPPGLSLDGFRPPPGLSLPEPWELD